MTCERWLFSSLEKPTERERETREGRATHTRRRERRRRRRRRERERAEERVSLCLCVCVRTQGTMQLRWPPLVFSWPPLRPFVSTSLPWYVCVLVCVLVCVCVLCVVVQPPANGAEGARGRSQDHRARMEPKQHQARRLHRRSRASAPLGSVFLLGVVGPSVDLRGTAVVQHRSLFSTMRMARSRTSLPPSQRIPP